MFRIGWQVRRNGDEPETLGIHRLVGLGLYRKVFRAYGKGEQLMSMTTDNIDDDMCCPRRGKRGLPQPGRSIVDMIYVAVVRKSAFGISQTSSKLIILDHNHNKIY